MTWVKATNSSVLHFRKKKKNMAKNLSVTKNVAIMKLTVCTTDTLEGFQRARTSPQQWTNILLMAKYMS